MLKMQCGYFVERLQSMQKKKDHFPLLLILNREIDLLKQMDWSKIIHQFAIIKKTTK